jgi:shikimate kinase
MSETITQPPPLQRIVVTGFMGAGKTTVARSLAERLACVFVDLDQFICEREKRTIAAIIDEEGLHEFRRIETNALRDVLKNDSARVLALGGGAWTIERNRRLILQHGAVTVWLDASFELCWQRIIAEDDSRPLARDRKRAQQLFLERIGIYQLAQLHIRIDEAKSVLDTVTEITQNISKLSDQREING